MLSSFWAQDFPKAKSSKSRETIGISDFVLLMPLSTSQACLTPSTSFGDGLTHPLIMRMRYIFLSLPATTFASLHVSYSAPTQCSSFQIAWDDSHFLHKMFILPLALDNRPVNLDRFSLLAPLHDTQTRTSNYTLNVLPLKSGTQFVLAMDYASGALSSPLQIHE